MGAALVSCIQRAELSTFFLSGVLKFGGADEYSGSLGR